MRASGKKPNKYIARMGAYVSATESASPVEAFVDHFRIKGEDLDSLARRLGAVQITRKRLPFEGAISLTADHEIVISINSLSHPLRQRFTLAHEIGHLMLWGVLRKKTGCGVDRDLERASDAVAAELLLPKQEVLSFARTLVSPSPGNLRLVSRKFEVSLQSAALRLCSDLKVWSRSFGLWEYGGGPPRQLRTSEPNGSSFPRESWFVGNRRWQTKYPPFRVFSEALSSSTSVRAHESYFEDGVMKPINLEVLHLGRGRLLAAVQ